MTQRPHVRDRLRLTAACRLHQNERPFFRTIQITGTRRHDRTQSARRHTSMGVLLHSHNCVVRVLLLYTVTISP